MEPEGLTGLDVGVRVALAAVWTSDGRRELLGLAELSRISLDLLGLGSPPDLLELVHAAAVAEGRAAERCFALASAYAAKRVEAGAVTLPDRDDEPITRAEMAAACARAAPEHALRAEMADLAEQHAMPGPIADTLAAVGEVHRSWVTVASRIARFCTRPVPPLRKPAEIGPDDATAGLPDAILRLHGRVPQVEVAAVCEAAFRAVELAWATEGAG